MGASPYCLFFLNLILVSAAFRLPSSLADIFLPLRKRSLEMLKGVTSKTTSAEFPSNSKGRLSASSTRLLPPKATRPKESLTRFSNVMQMILNCSENKLPPSPHVHCGGTLRANSGEIQTPNFPFHYPRRTDCQWKIVVSGSSITLNFEEFELETSQDCIYDYLEIYDGESDTANRLGKLCGSETPGTIESSGPQLFLRFHSDSSGEFKGFKLRYVKKADCSRTFSGENGLLRSPNHPDDHPALLNCSYLICVPKEKLVSLRFTHFDLEPDAGCAFDYIEVYDGPGTYSPKLGKYCGNDIPDQIRSSTNELLVIFVTDNSLQYSGFAAAYTAEFRAVTNLCLVNNGGCSDECSQTSDGRVCSCKPGFTLDRDGVTCRDYDDCIINNGGCDHLCLNTPGSFHCKCNDGYLIDSDNKTCINENECATGNNNCEQLCRDTEQGYYCECHKGYKVGLDGFTCQDLDECKLPKSFHHCQHTCVNTPGSYYCKCNKGFILSANGRICRDEDECLMGGTKCEQQCVNTPGSFHCDCYTGYHRDHRLPHKCVDTDECSEGRPDCHKCMNSEGSFRCECDEGYITADNETRCADIDECAVNNGGCSQNCVNMDGSYMCECSEGYNATDPESLNCEDIDECARNNGKGECDYACANSVGSFRCSCAAGFHLDADGLTCHDINECQANNGNCSQKCINTQGDHSCSCFEGFVNSGSNGTDVICIDIDECFDEIHQCDSLAKCHNTPGNYSCQCPDGYSSQWKDCIDIDECTKPEINQCEQVCNNTPGSFHCECRQGFDLQNDSKTCSDIDECKLGKCEKGCLNTVGSYQCLCPAGYQLAADGHHCEDIDECLEDNGGCDQRCVNENGSYSCACHHGFKLLRDGSTCRDIDECLLNTACCNQGCFNTEGSYNCSCYQGYTSSSNCTCVDVNECQTNNGGCEQICTNNPGSHRCSCNSGFVIDSSDPKRCVDINECLTDNGGCHHNCTNSPGSYQCTCHPTFKLQIDGKTCGHCPTCSDFEALLQTVEQLKNKLASIEVWKQSVDGQGCVFELEIKPDGTSWKKSQCEICRCEKNQTRCESISGCSETTAQPLTTEEMITITHDDNDDDDGDEPVSSTSSGDLPTSTAASKTLSTERELSESELFTINKKKRLQ